MCGRARLFGLPLFEPFLEPKRTGAMKTKNDRKVGRPEWALGAAMLVVAILLAVTPARAESILPKSFSGWTQASASPFAPSGLAMSVAAEYGFASGQQATYTHGADRLDVTLYRMSDASGGYGEYSYLRMPDMAQADLAEHSAISSTRALVLEGNLVLDVRGRDLQKFETSLKALMAAVRPHAENGMLPALWTDLPATNRIQRTDHYVLGPTTLNQLFPVAFGEKLGFAQGAEAEVASYRLAGHDATLLIVDYPTPQAASTKLKELQQQYNVNDSQTNNNTPPLYAKRTLTLLSFVAGAKSHAEADALLNQIQTGEQVTWNEPTFALTQPNIGTIVVGTIIGTGIICMFALISGLAFGGVRIIVKRMLPDKVFDRSDQMQILQLGLLSKPIKAEDFYGIGSPQKG
jgi:hypothetical protein